MDKQIPQYRYVTDIEHQNAKKSGCLSSLTTLFAILLTILISVLTTILLLTQTPLKNMITDNSMHSFTPPAADDDHKNRVDHINNTDKNKMIEQASKSVVGVINKQSANNPYGDLFGNLQKDNDSVESGTGSGVIYKIKDGDAYIVTNHHVVEGASNIEINLSDNQRIEAELLGSDPLTDIAVVKAKSVKGMEAIDFANSSDVKIGDDVMAIGNPLGLEFSNSVTEGIISGTEREMNVRTSEGHSTITVMQTDAAINPGNSGGALVNQNGDLVGINSMKISSTEVEGIGFAIPSNEVDTLIQELETNGSIERPYVGISMIDVENLPKEYIDELKIKDKKGIVIAQKDPKANHNLKQGDVITKINDEAVNNIAEFRKYLYDKTSVGDRVEFTIIRDGKTTTETVTLSSRNEQLQ